MKIIGINGFKRSGKGTTADAFEKVVAGSVRQVGFADKVKLWAARALGYLDLTEQEAVALMDHFKDDGYIWAKNKNRVNYFTQELNGRQYLQNIGNEARKMFGDTFWIDQVLPHPGGDDVVKVGVPPDQWNQAALAARYDADYLVVTDLRYPNEAERIKALGGVIWRVNRDGTASDGHSSEIPLDDSLVDWEIDNNGDLFWLQTQVEKAMRGTLS